MSTLQLGPDYALYYETLEGREDRPWLVFLHEGLGCTALWKDFPQKLCEATGCPGLLYDRLGYGRSSPLHQARSIHYLHQAALWELPRVLESVIPGQDYLLVGHSDGGSIALLHGAERPSHLLGLITEAAHVFVEPETIQGIEAADAAYEAGKLHGLSRYHGDKTETIFKAWSQTWLDDAFQAWNIEYLLPSIEVPALIMQGEDDQYATQAQVTSIIGTATNRQAAMIPDCGHTPHQEQPEMTLASMSAFVEKVIAL